MKSDTIDKIFALIFRYVWILCALILAIEVITTISTINIIMLRTTKDIIEATQNEIENKIDATLKLAEALSKDAFLNDPNTGMIEKGRRLRPYADVYGLFLIGITDREGTITSSYDDIPGYIGDRNYFKDVIATGKHTITEAFLAGADGKTKNYTICYPLFNDNSEVSGTIIMSILYDDLNNIALRTLRHDIFNMSVFDKNNIVMSNANSSLIGKSFKETLAESIIYDCDINEINRKMLSDEEGEYWAVNGGTLRFVRYVPINSTGWCLVLHADVVNNAKPILWQFLFKFILYISIFTFISLFGKMYTTNKLKNTNMLIKQITELQYEYQSQKILSSDEISEFIEISKKGLLDGLTKLPTRSVFLQQQKLAFEFGDINQNCACVIVDLDFLKQINDKYGHDAGDCALKHIGDVLNDLSHEIGCLVCRYGGDEFVAMIPYRSDDEIQDTLGELSHNLHKIIAVGINHIEINSSIGVALYPKHGRSFEALCDCADKALYTAKQNGRGCYKIYDDN